jgi:hypothetical protein
MVAVLGPSLDKETFSRRLMRVLEDRGRTPYWLAKKLGKTNQAILNWASGQSEPGAFTLAAAERALGLPSGYLVNDDVDDALPVPAPTDDDAE